MFYLTLFYLCIFSRCYINYYNYIDNNTEFKKLKKIEQNSFRFLYEMLKNMALGLYDNFFISFLSSISFKYFSLENRFKFSLTFIFVSNYL